MKYADIEGLTQKDFFKKTIVGSLSSLSSPLGIGVLPNSLHEPAAVLDVPGSKFYLAFKTDGVGTKTLIADSMSKHPKQLKRNKISVSSLYSGFGIDLVASNVNDLVCVGATPVAISDEIAAGDKNFFLNRDKTAGLVRGLKRGCRKAGIVIPSGESPTLGDIIKKGTFSITASAIGVIKPKSNLVTGGSLGSGDAIVGFKSNGIHTNGLLLARRIIEKLPHGYFTPFNAKTIGQELLKPTTIYSPLVLDLLHQGIRIHYMTHISGSAWRKLARFRKPLSYIVEYLPKPPKIFGLLGKLGKQSSHDLYQTWNMGIGFVIFTPDSEVEKIQKISRKYKIKAYLLGHIEKGAKKVMIKPLGITYQQ